MQDQLISTQAEALPATGRARYEKIIEEIVTHLRPWKRPPPPSQDAPPQDAPPQKPLPLEELVERSVRFQATVIARAALREQDRETPAEVERHAKRTTAAIAELGSPLSHKLLWQPMMDGVVEDHIADAVSFFSKLERLHASFDEVLNGFFCRAPNAEPLKDLCAALGHHLVDMYSKHRPTGTAESPFRATTSLLFEVATSERDHDLKCACDKILSWANSPGTNPQAI